MKKRVSSGGMLLYAVLPPFKGEWQMLLTYLINQLDKLGVAVRFNEECTASAVMEGKPDAVIVATGSVPYIPAIPGVNGGNVAIALDVLSGKKGTGQNVVVVGGGLIGCETAEFLHQQGKQVTILEMLPSIGADIGPRSRWVVIDRLVAAGIRMETGAKVEEITQKGVWISRRGRSWEFFTADSVIIAAGMVPFDKISGELEGKVAQIHRVGDCNKARRVKEAIEEGFLAALQV
ncbi:FAD-dependent oxidoreductase [Chloroflexota bacterium]